VQVTASINEAEIARALKAMAPQGVVTGARAIRPADLDALLDVELAAVSKAVPRRQHEFAGGRVLLRELLGIADAILVGPTRAPVLPPGVVGSLAHDRDVVIAAVSHDPGVTALGVDVEPAGPLSSGVTRLILRDDEVGLDAHLAFTLKEAAYKAWSTSGGRMLDHQDVRIEVGSSSFTATVLPDQRQLDGRFVTVAGRHAALVVVR
jgi:4'-phosphopantetheinyl transferase EntD